MQATWLGFMELFRGQIGGSETHFMVVNGFTKVLHVRARVDTLVSKLFGLLAPVEQVAQLLDQLVIPL